VGGGVLQKGVCTLLTPWDQGKSKKKKLGGKEVKGKNKGWISPLQKGNKHLRGNVKNPLINNKLGGKKGKAKKSSSFPESL